MNYLSAHIAKWVAENNYPVSIIADPELVDILTSGHPHIIVPTSNMVWHNVKAAYAKCYGCITKLLHDHLGHIHIATDVWTSTNHHAFVVWTMHLEHDGCMLAFKLDIVEVSESHTRVVLAKSFQKMLEVYELKDKVH